MKKLLIFLFLPGLAFAQITKEQVKTTIDEKVSKPAVRPVDIQSAMYKITDFANQADSIAKVANSGLSGYVPTGRTITINGTSQNLTANRTWNVGTVTSVGLSVPTGLSVAGSPVTGSGTLALSLASGYSIPTTANQTNWTTAYGWGNHAGLYPLLSGSYSDPSWLTLSKSKVGLGNVDNTSDANKPISTATQSALDLKANSSSLSGYAALPANNLFSGSNTFSGTVAYNAPWTNYQSVFGGTGQGGRISFVRGSDGSEGLRIGFTGATNTGSEILSQASLGITAGAGLSVNNTNASGTTTVSATGASGIVQLTASGTTAGQVRIQTGATESGRVFTNGNWRMGSSGVDNGNRLQVEGSANFEGLVATQSIIPDVTNVRIIGTTSVKYAAVHSSTFNSVGSMVLRTSSTGSPITIEQTNASSTFAGYFGTTGNYFNQAPGVAPADNGYRFQNYGTLYNGGDMQVAGNITPDGNNTRVLGGGSLNWNVVWGQQFVSGVGPSVTFGTTTATNHIGFRQGTSSVGGFFGTSGNFFVQPVGSFPTDNGHKFQLYGSQRMTGDMVHSSTSNVYNYNTVDETTNYERVRMGWSGNVFQIYSESAGTGSSIKDMRFGNTSSYFGLFDGRLPGSYRAITGSNQSTFSVRSDMTNSYGVGYGLAATPTVTQTGTAGYSAVIVSPYEASVGSGPKMLLNLGTNTLANLGGIHTSVFSVDNAGLATATQYRLSALNTAPASATSTGTLGEIRVTAGYIYVCTATNTWVRAALATW